MTVPELKYGENIAFTTYNIVETGMQIKEETNFRCSHSYAGSKDPGSSAV